jgi:hypothetical protein
MLKKCGEALQRNIESTLVALMGIMFLGATISLYIRL